MSAHYKTATRSFPWPWIRTMLFFGCLSLALTVFLVRGVPQQPSSALFANEPTFDIQKSWAQYSPYFSVTPYQSPPDGCEITQVNIIQRHGARFPTSGSGARIQAALAKLQAFQPYSEPSLMFLNDFAYNLGTDDLVPLGAAQSDAAGRVDFTRYQALVAENNLPFVRSSSSDRVIKSATNWTAGFSLASKHVYTPSLSVILREDGNDTLDDHGCPNIGSSDPQTNAWLARYAPAVAARLNKKAGVNLNFTDIDVYNLISMCPFHTVAATETLVTSLSPFCSLFDAEDFRDFEYSGDLDKYYGTGYGQDLGRVQGVGYVNELLARLTGKPVVDHTQTNTTLDSSPVTFPLNRTIYADFSHDNEMIAVYSALGLFNQSTPLDPTCSGGRRTWIAAHMVPFSARMITEKLACQGKEFVRILVNDALQPLEFCQGKDGLCELDAFVQSQAYARNDGDGDFERCFT
ncbi:acid phosphatase [Mycena floridula]|nr:acid phosphatase [Mycena floridula]